MPPLFITAVKDICTINTLEKLFNILCSDVYYFARNCSFIPKHSCVTTPNNTYDENYSLRSGHDKMQTTDYRMQTADCRPGTKCILGTKYTLHTEKWAQNAH